MDDRGRVGDQRQGPKLPASAKHRSLLSAGFRGATGIETSHEVGTHAPVPYAASTQGLDPRFRFAPDGPRDAVTKVLAGQLLH